MKTSIEALVAALKQVDNSHYLHRDEFAVQVDGYYENEPLEGALTEHLAPLASVIETRDPLSMFLREVWATGMTADGREFEVSASGVNLILSIGPFDKTREVYVLRLEKLAPAWLRAVGAGS